ncbi:MAG: D-Ala-D-Ala carboxypeptidase family metallohydrolase [Melioribacteraceae bacterium]
MREYYKPKHFLVQELVDPFTYKLLGENSLICMDIRILKLLDQLRDYFNKPMHVNDWHVGGLMKSRGFRCPSNPVGANFSQHRFGRAADFTIDEINSDNVREIILANQHLEPFDQITAMEKNITWVHVDIRMTGLPEIKMFDPS